VNTKEIIEPLMFNFLNSMNDPLIICNNNGEIIYENQAFVLHAKTKYGFVKDIFQTYEEIFSEIRHNNCIDINCKYGSKEKLIRVYAVLYNEEQKYVITFPEKPQNIFNVEKTMSQDYQFIANDPLTLDMIKFVEKIAKVDTTVLITGETGVGKEKVANLLYELSNRRDGPFVKINCTTLPEHLLESELFGYEKGAFTGASKNGKQGLFQAANNGTLLLDEIGDMPLSIQVKLLRFLQEGEIYKIGSTKPISLDVRVITATNKNLQDMVKSGDFREDLFYRLNVIPITIPPLRERPLDIVPMIKTSLSKCNDKYRLNKVISSNVLEILSSYQWPGNVRELQNLIERLVVTTDGDLIDVTNLPDIYRIQTNCALPLEIKKLKDARKEFERDYIQTVLKKYKSIRKTAKILGVDHTTILRKLK